MRQSEFLDKLKQRYDWIDPMLKTQGFNLSTVLSMLAEKFFIEKTQEDEIVKEVRKQLINLQTIGFLDFDK